MAAKETRRIEELEMNSWAPTPEIDQLIETLKEQDGVPVCKEWDVLTECAKTLEIERNIVSKDRAELIAALRETVSALDDARGFVYLGAREISEKSRSLLARMVP